MSNHTISRRRFVSAVALGGLPQTAIGVAADRGQSRNFRTHLSGENEVPSVETNARGQAIFQLSTTGDSLSYKLIVTNIENVVQAHIHLAPAGQNGSVVAWLYPEDGPPAELIMGRFNGVLAEGVITGEDLVGPLAGNSLTDLIEEMRDDHTYVNVHTQGYPSGEIRGQIQ